MSESTIAQRIKILSETLEEKSAAFLKATGLTYQNLHDLTSGRKGGPSYPTTMKILSAYPQVNEHWFLFGQGEMLKPVPGQDTGIKNPVVSASQTQRIEHGKPATHEGESVPTFRMKGNKPPEPVGTDLVRQVDKHTREIELMQQTLETVVAELRQLHTK